MKSKRVSVVTLASLSLLVSCAQAPRLRGQIAGLEKIVEQAERNGAVRCAPRELAVARSQLRFATIELDQGFVSKAQAHLFKAEPNAHAALDHSPPQYCAERGFVEARPAPGDKDGDGYLDTEDTCPEQPENFNGFQDQDGCPDDPDTDLDGLADSIDSCVMEPEDKDGYLDDDGCPEPDNDLDTLLDPGDKCPNEAEDPDGFDDQDGCPDPDNDGDTVARREGSVSERDRLDHSRAARLSDQAGARRRDGLRSEDHSADPLRVQQGQDSAGELPGARRRGRSAAEELAISRSRSRATPTTRARPSTTRISATAAPTRS